MGENVSTVELKRDEVRTTNKGKTKEHDILISDFKLDIPLILGVLVEVK